LVWWLAEKKKNQNNKNHTRKENENKRMEVRQVSFAL
jgi:hypothetical protein